MDHVGENEIKLLQDRGLCVRTNFPARIFGEWCAGCLAASRDRPSTAQWVAYRIQVFFRITPRGHGPPHAVLSGSPDTMDETSPSPMIVIWNRLSSPAVNARSTPPANCTNAPIFSSIRILSGRVGA
jgi:hypothetical protein